MNEKPQNKCKVILLGSAGVGKTSLMNSFMYNQFSNDYETTVGIDFFTKIVNVKGKPITLQIWDTAGQEQFHSLIPSYIRDSGVVILVYDLSNPNSISGAKFWHKKVLEIRGNDIGFFLVGNKKDLFNGQKCDEAIEFSKENNIEHYEVSAKTSDGVSILFNAITETSNIVHLEQQDSQPIILHPILVEKTNRGCPC